MRLIFSPEMPLPADMVSIELFTLLSTRTISPRANWSAFRAAISDSNTEVMGKMLAEFLATIF